MALRISSSALLPKSAKSLLSPPSGADGDSARPASVLELRPHRRASLRLRGFVRAAGNSNSTNSNGGGGGCSKKKGSVPSSNYVVPLDKSLSASYSSCITRPLAEILRDLNKKIPDNIIKSLPIPPASDPDQDPDQASNYIPWYHANRMLSFYAPGIFKSSARSLFLSVKFDEFLFSVLFESCVRLHCAIHDLFACQFQLWLLLVISLMFNLTEMSMPGCKPLAF